MDLRNGEGQNVQAGQDDIQRRLDASRSEGQHHEQSGDASVQSQSILTTPPHRDGQSDPESSSPTTPRVRLPRTRPVRIPSRDLKTPVNFIAEQDDTTGQEQPDPRSAAIKNVLTAIYGLDYNTPWYEMAFKGDAIAFFPNVNNGMTRLLDLIGMLEADFVHTMGEVNSQDNPFGVSEAVYRAQKEAMVEGILTEVIPILARLIEMMMVESHVSLRKNGGGVRFDTGPRVWAPAWYRIE